MERHRFYYLLLLTLLAGCGPHSGFRSQNHDGGYTYINPPTTGTERDVTGEDGQKHRIQYTPSGNVDLFEKLRTEKAESNSPELAKKIKNVDVKIDKNSNTDFSEFTISFTLEQISKPYIFKYTQKSGQLTEYKRVSPQQQHHTYNYYLDARCVSEECRKMILTLLQYNSSQVKVAEASSLYTKDFTHIYSKLALDNPDTQDPQVNEIVRKLKKNPESTKEVVTVIDGRSYSIVKVRDPEDANKTLMEITTDNLRTNELATPVQSVRFDATQKDLQKISSKAVLAGNDPSSGSLALDMQLGSSAEPVRARLYVPVVSDQEVSPTIDVPYADYPADQMYSQPIIPLIAQNSSSMDLSTSYEITQKLEKYRHEPEVQRYIKMWLGKNEHLNCEGKKGNFNPQNASVILPTIKKIAPAITSASNLIDAPPQVGYLIALEAEFGNELDLKQITSDRRSDASGVYQMLTTTAQGVINNNKGLLTQLGLNLKVFYTTEIERKHNRRQQNNTQKRELVREDARGYLTSATLLAGMYLLEMMNKNYNDPAIAIYEYRLGIRALEKAEEAFRQRHKGYDETLVNLARFDMADCKGLQHAFSWLALQFIGSNPAYYGLHIDESKALSKDYTQLAEVLFPPGIDKKLFNLKL